MGGMHWTDAEDEALRHVLLAWDTTDTSTFSWTHVAAQLADLGWTRTSSACGHRWHDYLSGRTPPTPGTRYRPRPLTVVTDATGATSVTVTSVETTVDDDAQVEPEPLAAHGPAQPTLPGVEPTPDVYWRPTRRPSTSALDRAVARDALRDLAANANTPPAVRLAAATLLLGA
jgi:hypothetical protein